MEEVRGSRHTDEVADAPAASQCYDVVIVGGGPRAVATVERLDARVRAAGAQPVSVVVIDAIEVGAGATWRTDQTRFFLNNTTSNATTIYPDESTPMDGPEADGPTFVEWAAEVAARGAHEVEWAVEEAREVTPGSFPSRRLQGVYYNDQLERVASRGGVELTRVLGTVIDVAAERDGAERRVRLADGRAFSARAVVLAQGMVQALPTQSVQGLADAAERLGLRYIAPGMPAEQPWHLVPGGEPVIARGLGANFFDVVAELTAGRGGRFEPVPDDVFGRLQYVASGEEPTIYATSRRGVPYRSKGDFGDERVARYAPRIARPDFFDRALLAEPRSIDFAAEIWPVIAAELGLAWVSALETRSPGSLQVSLGEAQRLLIQAAEHDVAAAGSREWVGAVPNVDRVLSEVVADAVIDQSDAEATALVPPARFRIDELRRPTLGEPVSPDEWDRLVQQSIEAELDSLANPLESPRQAGNRAMGALRGRVSQLAVRGVLTPESEVRDVHGWFNADGLFLASGPPASRVREVLALIEAGVVKLVGPDTSVSVDESAGVFRAVSSITGNEVAARTLIETRMSKGKVPSTSDPLLRNLLDRGDARIHSLSAGERLVETESLDTLPREAAEHPLSLVDASGTPDRRVLVLGIPASSTQPGSAIGASPGVPSPLLAGADRAAAVLLALREQDDDSSDVERDESARRTDQAVASA